MRVTATSSLSMPLRTPCARLLGAALGEGRICLPLSWQKTIVADLRCRGCGTGNLEDRLYHRVWITGLDNMGGPGNEFFSPG